MKEFAYAEFKSLLQKYFILKKIIGLKRLEKPAFDVVNSENYKEFDIYLAVCGNRKYIKEDYSDDYYKAVNEGFKMNPVGKIYTEAMAKSIVGQHILSIGCGTAILEKCFLDINPKLEIMASDISSTPFLKKIRKEHGIKNFIHVVPSKSYKQPFDNDSFDTVYTSHVLEHIEEPEKLIAESIRLTGNLACI